MLAALLRTYRRTGADLPFMDPAAAHGVGMEGYFWRFTDAATGRVVIALIGACRSADGPWALVALGAHPGGFQRHAIVPDVALSGDGLGVRAEDAFLADPGSLRVRIGDASLDVAIDPVRPWPRRSLGALGLGHVVPLLGQYWHPHLLHGVARGAVVLGGRRWSLDGASVYGEKNWGSVFAGHWWWGQAHGFDGGAEACVAFAGGRLLVGAPTALVVSLEDELLAFGPPTAHVTTATAPGRWRIDATSLTHRVELRAEADEADVHLLPVPVPAERRAELRSRQHLAGRVAVAVRRGRRLVWRGESSLAGLERGEP